MTTSNADADRLKDLAARIEADPCAAEAVRRWTTPGGEHISVTVYTSREGERITRAVRKGDRDGLLAEAVWAETYFQSHPGSSALTYGDIIHRRQLAKDALQGRNDGLRSEVRQRLDAAGSPAIWSHVWPVVQRMSINDLLPFVRLNPPMTDREPGDAPAARSSGSRP